MQVPYAFGAVDLLLSVLIKIDTNTTHTQMHTCNQKDIINIVPFPMKVKYNRRKNITETRELFDALCQTNNIRVRRFMYRTTNK